MPNLQRTHRRGVFTNGTSFYVRGSDGRWKRFATFKEAERYQGRRAPLPNPRYKPQTPAPQRPGWIYFIRPVGGGRIKIGYSRLAPERRLAELQTGSPEPLAIIGRRRGFREDERELHYRLAGHRSHREWFDPSPEVLHEASLTDEQADAEQRERFRRASARLAGFRGGAVSP